MQNISTKATGDSLTATEFNQIPDELENLIISAGITLSGADLNQLKKAVAVYASGGSFYTDSGVANAYVLSTVGSKSAPPALFDGMGVAFVISNTNTAASTVNVATLGVKNIYLNGAALVGGELPAGRIAAATYDLSNDRFNLGFVTGAYVGNFGNQIMKGFLQIEGAGDAMPFGGGVLRLVGTGSSTFGMQISSINPQYALFQTTSPGSTATECSIAANGYDSASVLQKNGSLSWKWANTNTNTGFCVMRLNATYQNGAGAYVDDLAIRIFGNNGVDIFGVSDTVGPGQLVMRVVGNSLTLERSRSGAAISASVDNLSNTASSNAWNWTRVAGTSAGDAFYSALLSGGQSWSWGLDNSDSDSFKISGASVLGTNDYLAISTAGVVTLSNLAGVGTRTVVASANGTLSAP